LPAYEAVTIESVMSVTEQADVLKAV